MAFLASASVALGASATVAALWSLRPQQNRGRKRRRLYASVSPVEEAMSRIPEGFQGSWWRAVYESPHWCLFEDTMHLPREVFDM